MQFFNLPAKFLVWKMEHESRSICRRWGRRQLRLLRSNFSPRFVAGKYPYFSFYDIKHDITFNFQRRCVKNSKRHVPRLWRNLSKDTLQNPMKDVWQETKIGGKSTKLQCLPSAVFIAYLKTKLSRETLNSTSKVSWKMSFYAMSPTLMVILNSEKCSFFLRLINWLS